MSTPMAAYKVIDPSTWERQSIYSFFLPYEDPFFSITVPVDITDLAKDCKARKQSLFLHYLHGALSAVNEIQAFRLRFGPEGLRDYQCIHAGCTVSRPDRTFGFGFFPYHANRADFVAQGAEVLEHTRHAKVLSPLDERPDVAFFSVLPWLSFTSFKNPHRHMEGDAFPRIVFGKMSEYQGRWQLPVAVEVHHALADGIHVGDFFDSLRKHWQP